MDLFIWLGIAFCVSQSAMFSGLNLAFFSVTRLRLEIEAESNAAAKKVLAMRQDSNFLLTTILWGNVGINVLLTLLSNSVMAGLVAFLFSTFIITFAGEILPQAYFSRHALKMASLLSPVLRFYQILLYPVAKPCALLLDAWLGGESIYYFKEKTLEKLIHKHLEESPDIDHVEGKGAINFLHTDDIPVSEEGELIHPNSIIHLSFEDDRPVFPKWKYSPKDKFLQQLHKSSKKWVILVDPNNNPQMVLDADGFLRHALFEKEDTDPMDFVHRPIIVREDSTPLGQLIQQFEYEKEHLEDDVIDSDIILLWARSRRIITGADILGRLLRGISQIQGGEHE